MIAAIVTALALGLSVQADAEPIHSAPAADILADPRAANADWLFSIVEPRFDAAISAPDDNAPEIAELSVLIRRLTDERHPGGMNLMGVLVMNGIGRTANPDAALGYYERAYRAGNPAAAVNFGTYRLYESELNRQISGFDALQSVVNNADAPQ